MLNRRTALTLFLFLFFTTNAFAVESAKPGSCSITEADGLTVATLSGSAREIGSQHAAMFADKMPGVRAAFTSLMPDLPGGPIVKWLVDQAAMFQSRFYEKFLTPDEVEEMQALAGTMPEPEDGYREVMLFHVLQDIGQKYSCTGAAAAGKSSALGGPLAGRNFDMDNRGLLDRFRTVFFYKKYGRYSFASVAWPGMVGVVSGMNERGVCVMIFSARSENVNFSGVPVVFLARRILENAADVDEAAEIVEGADRGGPGIFLVADEKRVSVIEFDAERVAVRSMDNGKVIVSNHFVSPLFSDDRKNARHERYSDSGQRYRRMYQIIGNAKVIGPRLMMRALRDNWGTDGRVLAFGDPSAISNIKCAHSVIFDTKGRRMFVSAPPYNSGRFAGFRVAKNSLSYVKPLPADKWFDTRDAINTRVSDLIQARAEQEGLTGDRAFAKTLAEEALSFDPENYLAANSLGNLCLKEDDNAGAELFFSTAVKFAPDSTQALAEAYSGRGLAREKLGKINNAREDYISALSLGCSEKADGIAWHGIGRIK
jgi:tetratricopeptide (TPR) repeat protein